MGTERWFLSVYPRVTRGNLRGLDVILQVEMAHGMSHRCQHTLMTNRFVKVS